MRCILLAVLLVAGVGAEQSQKVQLAPGTARIRGTVVDAGTATPVRRASLRLTMTSPGRGTWTAITDGSGAFEFPNLPAGRFVLSVTKGGYVSLGPGQQDPRDPARPIATSDGSTVDLPPIMLPRGGVITGRILDEYGDAVPEITVQAFRAEYIRGVRRLSSARSGQTNDIGQFRLYGLQPGTYYVAASARGADGRPITIAEPGTEAVAGAGGLAPTFFPGTVMVSQAQRIEVSAGSEIPGVDFSLLPVRLARLSGTVVDSRGKPVSGYVVMLNQARPEAWQLGELKVAEADDSGRFALPDVPPGEYRLDVRSKASIEAIARTGGAGQSQADDAPEFASVPLSVNGEDVPGLTIRLTPGFEMRGRVVAGGSALSPDELTKIRVSVLEGIPGMSATMLAAGASVQDDATFRVRGLIGRRFVRVSGLPQGWVLESVHAGGVDVTDAGIDIQQDVHDVQITLTNRPGAIAGIVTDASGNPAPGAAVAIFPEDRDRRAAPLNRFLATVRTGPDGKFEVKGLPPGTYFAFAVPRLVDGEWAHPDQLERTAPRATRVTLADGQSIAIALRLIDR